MLTFGANEAATLTCNASTTGPPAGTCPSSGWPSYPNSNTTCVNGVYGLSCNPGYANGNGIVGDGCEINLLTDVANCGGVGHPVPQVPNANVTCINGSGAIASCKPGYYDVDGVFATGCESPVPPSTCTPRQHSNGLGQFYNDCAFLGNPGDASTYTQTMAFEAAQAWIGAGHVGTSVSGICNGGGAVIVSTAGGSAVWEFGGALAGRVHPGPPLTSGCPIPGDQVWN